MICLANQAVSTSRADRLVPQGNARPLRSARNIKKSAVMADELMK